MSYLTFRLVILGLMLFITACSYALSREYFSSKLYKNARLKMLVINIIMMIAFYLCYPPNNIPLNIYSSLGQLLIMWFMVQLFLIVLGILVKIFRLLYEKSRSCQVDDSKRQFLRGLIWVPAISGIMYGGLYERRNIEFNSVDIGVINAPKLNGLKIVQLSDVHLGAFFSVGKLQRLLNQIVQQSPDILVMTGDIFDCEEINDKAIELIDKYSAYFPFGVYFCWGNHEYMRNIKHLQEVLAKTNIKVLRNESIKILSGDRELYILGVDYVHGEDDEKSMQMREAYLTKALNGVPDNAYKVLLSHHSIFIDNAFSHNIDLTLTGHTHGGQFALLGQSLFPLFKYMMGRVDKDNCTGYVSRGAGSWFPFRLGCPPEVTTFNFVSKE